MTEGGRAVDGAGVVCFSWMNSPQSHRPSACPTETSSWYQHQGTEHVCRPRRGMTAALQSDNLGSKDFFCARQPGKTCSNFKTVSLRGKLGGRLDCENWFLGLLRWLRVLHMRGLFRLSFRTPAPCNLVLQTLVAKLSGLVLIKLLDVLASFRQALSAQQRCLSLLAWCPLYDS